MLPRQWVRREHWPVFVQIVYPRLMFLAINNAVLIKSVLLALSAPARFALRMIQFYLGGF
jgi:hypothetical protein